MRVGEWLPASVWAMDFWSDYHQAMLEVNADDDPVPVFSVEGDFLVYSDDDDLYYFNVNGNMLLLDLRCLRN